jgi:GMP synthase (glutamine-hydrolysing)
MSASWWCLQHVDFEGPAAIADAFAAHGVTLRVVRLDLGEPLPAVGDVAGLVVMGGPMGALDDADHPYLAAERAFLAECVARDLPVLGVCLGAQLLAAALGASVHRGPRGEVGAGTVTLTAAGLADPVLGGSGSGTAELPVVHWHHDTFDLPAGAALLASSERYEHQAFRHGRAYGLQFHVELGTRDLGMMRANMNPARVPSEEALRAVEGVGDVVLDRFVDLSTRTSGHDASRA